MAQAMVPVCKFFAAGRCSSGTLCRFSHEGASGGNPAAGKSRHVVKRQDLPSSTHSCRFFMLGLCQNGSNCRFVHGKLCPLCGLNCLHPTDESIRSEHITQCTKQEEERRAIEQSRDRRCGVCFDLVIEKSPVELRKFGILLNCVHCFCLSCIRKWRRGRDFETTVRRGCPECRVLSDFVCPSSFWVETKQEKGKLIESYMKALSTINCKYFELGWGTCPFGNKCFYLHADVDGTVVDVGPPPVAVPRLTYVHRVVLLQQDFNEIIRVLNILNSYSSATSIDSD